MMGAHMHMAIDVVVPSTVLLLCFIMGLQNAVITKISRAQIRTTHLTGVLTDLGIELGRLVYWNRTEVHGEPIVRADRQRLAIHFALTSSFFCGAVFGALAFKHVGYVSTVPLALLLATVASPTLLRDFRQR